MVHGSTIIKNVLSVVSDDDSAWGSVGYPHVDPTFTYQMSANRLAHTAREKLMFLQADRSVSHAIADAKQRDGHATPRHHTRNLSLQPR